MSHLVWQYIDHVGQRLDLIDELEKLQGSILGFETVKLLRDVNDTDLPKVRAFMTAITQIQIKVYRLVVFRFRLRFEEVSFSCYSKGELKFRSRLFPQRVGLKITSLDLIGVIEDEEFFSKICDEDVARDSKPTVDLRPTFGEYLTEWWTFNNELLKNYIHRTPTQTPDLFYAYPLKVVSGRQWKKYSRIMTTSIPTVPRSKISMLKENVITDLNSRIFKLEAIIQFCDELNKEFLNFFDSPSISSGTCCSDLDIDEDADEFMMKLEVEEMLLFKEKQILEEESRLRLEEGAKMMHKEENMLEEEKFFKKDYKNDLSRCNTSIDNFWLTEDLDTYLGKPGMLCYFHGVMIG
nr:phospholipase-like protein [Tanacetum cinerariifolium]